MTRDEIITTPIYWTNVMKDETLPRSVEYKKPDGTLWKVESVNDSVVKVWTQNAWGQIHQNAVPLTTFLDTWQVRN